MNKQNINYWNEIIIILLKLLHVFFLYDTSVSVLEYLFFYPFNEKRNLRITVGVVGATTSHNEICYAYKFSILDSAPTLLIIYYKFHDFF